MLTGCGETDQEKAREVAQDYVDARSDGDAQAICKLFSDRFKQEMGASRKCQAVVKDQTSPGKGSEQVSLVDVRVRGDRAKADIDIKRDGQDATRVSLSLADEDGDWKVAGVN